MFSSDLACVWMLAICYRDSHAVNCSYDSDFFKINQILEQRARELISEINVKLSDYPWLFSTDSNSLNCNKYFEHVYIPTQHYPSSRKLLMFENCGFKG